jgi:translation initiation factor 5B
MADELGVKVFTANIIYHLQDMFLKYRYVCVCVTISYIYSEELREKARREHAHLAIFPCKLKILPQHVYKTRDPIVMGVNVEAGALKIGTPLCVPSKEVCDVCLFVCV